MKLHLFNIGNFKIDGGAMFGVVPKILWSRVYSSDENNLVPLTLRSLIIEIPGHVILVDTGWGDKQDEKFFRHVHQFGGEGLEGGLRNRGYSTGDVTDVVLTHLHADHCGGGVKKKAGGDGYELTFPNAVYHVSRTQWEWAMKNNLREADSFLEENIIPIGQSGRLNLIDEGELYPGIHMMMCHGHTPGLMLPRISHNGRTLVYTGDLIPTSAHIPLIWNMSYDIESLKTIDEKKHVLEDALDNDHILIFQHDINVECCDVTMTNKGIRMKTSLALSELFSAV